jgi:hypothetical protein
MKACIGDAKAIERMIANLRLPREGRPSTVHTHNSKNFDDGEPRLSLRHGKQKGNEYPARSGKADRENKGRLGRQRPGEKLNSGLHEVTDKEFLTHKR